MTPSVECWVRREPGCGPARRAALWAGGAGGHRLCLSALCSGVEGRGAAPHAPLPPGPGRGAAHRAPGGSRSAPQGAGQSPPPGRGPRGRATRPALRPLQGIRGEETPGPLPEHLGAQTGATARGVRLTGAPEDCEAELGTTLLVHPRRPGRWTQRLCRAARTRDTPRPPAFSAPRCPVGTSLSAPAPPVSVRPGSWPPAPRLTSGAGSCLALAQEPWHPVQASLCGSQPEDSATALSHPSPRLIRAGGPRGDQLGR